MNVPMTEAMVATAKPTMQRNTRAVDHARIDIAAQHVGAEPILRRWCTQPLDGRKSGRVHCAQEWRQERDQEHDAEQQTLPPTIVG